MVTYLKPTIKNIPYILLFALSFYPLMPEAIFSISVFLFLISTVIIYGKNLASTSTWKLYKLWPFVINTGFYIIILISVFYSTTPFIAAENLQPTVLLFLFPVVLLVFPRVDSTILSIYSIGFILANFILLCYFFNILVEGMRIDRFNWLLDASLIDKIKALWSLPYEFTISKAHKHLEVHYESHKTYLSLNFMLSILLAVRLISVKIHALFKVFILIVSILFGVFIIYTQAITVIFSLFIFIIFYPFLLFNRKRIKLVYLLSLIVLFCVLYQTNVFNAFNNKNSKSIALLVDYVNTGELKDGIDTRAYIYDCSIKLIRNSLWFGYGVGDVQTQLNSCYDLNEYEVARHESIGKDINSHNYYFHLMLSGGFLCLLMFLFLLLNNSILSIREKDYVYLFFLIVISLNLLTENLLVRINGVTAFVILNTFFYSNILARREGKAKILL